MDKNTLRETMIPVSGNKNFTHVRLTLYYSLGGMNMWTYKNDPRGYYMSVSPVRKVDCGTYAMIECAPSDGFKSLIKPVVRRSKKADAEAINASNNVLDELLNAIFSRHSLTRMEG